MYTSNNFFSSEKHRTALLVLLSVVLFLASIASVIHWVQPHPFLIDRVIPPLAVLWIGFLIHRAYYCHYAHLNRVFFSFIVFAAFALITPAWFYTWYAVYHQVRLVDIYPPISVLLIILTTMILLLLDTRPALRWGGSIWLLNAVPILVYLFAHKNELWSPRGLDMFLSFGPALLCVVAVIPFHRSFSNRLLQLSVAFEQMKNIAERDQLTDLFNRRGGSAAFLVLSQQPNREQIAALMLDIDHFKAINDLYGHSVGDRVLREMAARLRTVSDESCMIARWGGEEFLVLVPNTPEETLADVAEKFHRDISETAFNNVGVVTVSIGAVMYQNEALDSLVDRADKALYEAKQAGRDCVVCH